MLTLADLMTHHVDQLPLSARLGDAADIMLRGRISSVVVVEDSSVKGIVTERDIVKAMHAELPSETPVSDIMTSPVLTAPIGQDFRSAYQMAVSHQIRHLVVVDAEGTPRGVVTETDIRRHLGLDFFRKLSNVDALMTRDFLCYPPDACLDGVLADMETQRASCALVAEEGVPVGILTERDVVRLFLAEKAHAVLGEVMTSPVASVHEDTTLADAAQYMLERHFRHLAVTDEKGRLIGLLSEHDLLRPLDLDVVDDALIGRAVLEGLRAEAQERLRLVMQAIDDGVWDFDVIADRITCNERVFDMLGYPADAFVFDQALWRSFIHPEDLPAVKTGYEITQNQATEAFEAEYRLKRRDGSWLWVLSRGRVVAWDSDGNPTRRVGTITDISRRKAVEDALQVRESYQRAVLDNFPFQVWLKDTASRFLAVNEPFAHSVGLPSPLEIAGKTDFDLWPAFRAERHVESDQAVMARRSQEISEDLVWRGEERVWLETYKAPVIGQDGRLLGSVGFARDVSEKKRNEEAVLLRNAALAGLIRNEPLPGILDLICFSVEAERPGWMCAILLVDEGESRIRMGAAPRLPDGCRDMLEQAESGEEWLEYVFRGTAGLLDLAHYGRNWAALTGSVAVHCEPVRGAEGVMGAFCVHLQDTCALSNADTELLQRVAQLVALVLSHQRNTRRLHASQATFRGILDSISEAFLILDGEGICLDVNMGAERLFGVTRQQILGASYQQVSAPGLNDPVQIACAMAGVISGKAHQGEYWALRSDGIPFPVEVHMYPGTYFGQSAIIVTIMDITARREAATRLEIEHDLAQALASGLKRDMILQRVLDSALRFPEFDSGAIYGQDVSGGYELLSWRGLSSDFPLRAARLAEDAEEFALMQRGRPVCSCRDGCHNADQAEIDPGLIGGGLLGGEGLSCVALLPILVDGLPTACLCLGGRQAKQISRATFDSLLALESVFSHTLLRLQAQEEGQRLQRNLSGLFDTVDDFIFILDELGNILNYNRAITDKLGYAPGALLGRSVLEVHPEAARPAVSQIMAEMLGGQRAAYPLPLMTAQGAQVMAETRVVPGYWNGKPAYFGISRDMTQRLAAEERQRLAASVFEHAHEGIVITDPRGMILEINSTFSDLTGYSREEAIGHPSNLLRSGHHGPEFYHQMWASIRQHGYWRGEVWNRKKDGEIFVELLTISSVRNQTGDVTHYVGIFSDITQQKKNQERLEHLAHFDALTQLPNRMLLADRMQTAMGLASRTGKALAVCYLDLDGFKPVNDELGHAAGDRLLVDVAQRLKLCVRAGDTVARLGGDEFVLLISGIDNERECDRALSRVISSLSAPFSIAEREVSISASIGVTLYPHDGADSDTLLRHADQAMYAAKQAGRNRYHLFDPESDRLATTRRAEIARLREALERGEFVLYYQPKVDMRQGRVLGAEALIRWLHPERGLVPPMEFLPAIEGSDFSVTLGEWVISEALRQLDVWNRDGLEVTVSVNIAGNHLQTHGFAERLQEQMACYPNVSPSQLELEVLETAALDDINQVTAVFAACRELGVSFALDDFGTGYSSLTYFRRLPAEMLKIDQSFVRDMLDDPDDLAIVEGVIGLTQAFRRKVIAEGVETVEHGMVLLQLGCDLAQGYGIARPMPASAFPDWVREYQPDNLWSASASFQWSREDLPMLVAEADHNRWRRSLQAFLEDKTGKLKPPASDPTACRFGRWYAGPTRERYQRYDSFAQLGDLHRQIHALGVELVACKALSNEAELAERYQALEGLSRELSDTIQMLQAEVLLSQQGNGMSGPVAF